MIAMKSSLSKVQWGLAAAGLFWAAATWAVPVPTGVMSEYLVHCHSWLSESVAACVRLADRLAAVETPTRAERLALHKARVALGRESDDCPGLAEITADHPDYAYALYFLSFCLSPTATGGESAVAMLKRAAEIEPDNFLVLQRLLLLVDGFPPESPQAYGPDVIADPVVGDKSALAAYREAMYEAGKARADWWQMVMKEAGPDDPPTEDFLQAVIWEGLLGAGRHIHASAERDGDLSAAAAIRDRVRQDLGLDDLYYGDEESARASLALACQPLLYANFGLEDACLSGVEREAMQASAAGRPLPGYVLKKVELAGGILREAACVESTGATIGGRLAIYLGDCLPETTETPAVQRLQAVLEHHDGVRSSEHHRVLAQGFLGGEYRIEGLREALRVDAGNDRARCELATALAGRGDAAGAVALGGDPKCMERGDFAWGDVGSFRREPGLSAD